LFVLCLLADAQFLLFDVRFHTNGVINQRPTLKKIHSGKRAKRAREADGRLSGAAIKLVPYPVAAPDYSRTVYDRDFFSAAIL
jgi:hypothetical protein